MTVQEQYKHWLAQAGLDAEVKGQLAAMAGNEKEIYESFYRELEFGTGGLRGILGAGTNRMNIYTVAKATQGLASYLQKQGGQPKAAISYDSRINSRLFAQVAARVLAANGVTVYIYPRLMPTPCLSFAVRHYGCGAGIMITASHNPAKYNGYKAYGPDGCQLTLEAADEVLGYINQTDIFRDVKMISFEEALGKLIHYIPEETEKAFLEAVAGESVLPDKGVNRELRVVYTPLNGAGNIPVRQILQRVGITQVTVVPEQEMPDGNFPTCPYPNPEVREALAKGLELCERVRPDLLLATDPDCDRVGIAVADGGEYRLLSGNEVGVLLLDYICRLRRQQGTMPPEPVAVKTIVTTAMAADVAQKYGVEMRNVLTGFKFIGEQIGLLEAEGHPERYILGFEESYGYLSGHYVRDKDAVNGAMMICEMAAYYKSQKQTLCKVLETLYEEYGYYRNALLNFSFEGASGMEQMQAIMKRLREKAPTAVCGQGITAQADYLTSLRREGEKEIPLTLPKSDVLEFILESGSSFIVRPSGTEPKLKVYISAKGASARESEAAVQRLEKELTALIKN